MIKIDGADRVLASNSNSKKDRFKNCDYQFSHVFSETTKNPLAFNAPWNMCRIPRFVDPLTGYETSWNDGKVEFDQLFFGHIKDSFQTEIETYNNWMLELVPSLISALDSATFQSGQFKTRMLVNFRPLLFTNHWQTWYDHLEGEEQRTKWIDEAVLKFIRNYEPKPPFESEKLWRISLSR
jgi:hypothetical protein